MVIALVTAFVLGSIFGALILAGYSISLYFTRSREEMREYVDAACDIAEEINKSE